MQEQLYRKLTTELQRQLPTASKPQVRNLALLTQAMVFSKDCHLSNLALAMPIAGQRESLVQRLVRYLDNKHVNQRSPLSAPDTPVVNPLARPRDQPGNGSD